MRCKFFCDDRLVIEVILKMSNGFGHHVPKVFDLRNLILHVLNLELIQSAVRLEKQENNFKIRYFLQKKLSLPNK